MITIASYFLCYIWLLKYEEVTPSENQPAKTATEKETFRTLSVPLKSEGTEEMHQDYYPGMLIYVFFYGDKRVFIVLNRENNWNILKYWSLLSKYKIWYLAKFIGHSRWHYLQVQSLTFKGNII